ncbi:MAG: glycosyl transferase [Dehalococcoidia bacterium]|nr:MAG: glycosyl transferase [Dehalococcoidia bacterium]
MADLFIVIVSYNVERLLRDCLRSVFASTGVSFEVVVVDNQSTDGSAAMVRDEFPEARLIESPYNGGFAYANNLALREYLARPAADRPRYVLLLNPDTVVPTDALAEMTTYLDARPRVGAAGPKLLLADGSLDYACRRSFPSPAVAFYRMVGLSKLFPRSRRFGRYNLTYLSPDIETEVDSVVGAFMLVRGSAIEEVGLLDETFFMYGEDLDWAFRLKERGWSIRYNPAVTVLHYKGQSSRQRRARTTLEFYRAMDLFYRKHYARRYPPAVNHLVFAAIQGFRLLTVVSLRVAPLAPLPQSFAPRRFRPTG